MRAARRLLRSGPRWCILRAAMPKKKANKSGLIVTGLVADNRRARHEYALEDAVEAGLALVGTEVKSLRAGGANIAEAYIGPRGRDLYLLNAHIAEYPQAGPHLQHAPRRPRRLLLKRREIDRMLGAVTRAGHTIVPLRLYFTERGLAKLSLALGKGKKLHDKRESDKARDWAREKARILREKG